MDESEHNFTPNSEKIRELLTHGWTKLFECTACLLKNGKKLEILIFGLVLRKQEGIVAFGKLFFIADVF